jgi:glycosyltransferase involved in cell wall biosynthesis
LLQAAQQILASGRDARFVFVGDGPAREGWMRLASVLRIAEKVFFAGRREDMPSVYASLNILALPSFDEAMPMCILEAMAAGVAVVASRVGAVPELMTANSTGCLVEAGKVEDLAAELEWLLDNPNLAAQLGREAARRIDRLFSAEAMARRYLELYKEAMRGKTAFAEVA